jgi:hypothetical protein
MRSFYTNHTANQEIHEARMAEINAKKLAKQNAAKTSTKSTEITKSKESKLLLEMQELEQKIPNEKSRQEKLKMQLRLKELGNLLPQIQSTENDFVDLGGISEELKPDPFSEKRTGVIFPRQKQAYASKQRNNKFATDPQAGKAWAIQNSRSRQLNHNKNNISINGFTLNNNNMYNEVKGSRPSGIGVSKRKRKTKRRKKTKKMRRTKRR